MALSKREIAGIERQLVAALTEACETAKAEIPGFEWLTHTVNYTAFPPKPAYHLGVRHARQQGPRPGQRRRPAHARVDRHCVAGR